MTVKIDGTNTVANPAFTGADTDTGLQCGTDELKLVTGGSARATVDSAGRVLVGTSSNTALGTDSYLSQIKTSGASAGLGIVRTADSVAPPFLSLAKSRNDGIVQDNDFLGKIQFIAHDGNDYNNVSALIQAEVDGTPGSDDVPGALTFHTTADGASSPTERVRISSAGRLSGDALAIYQVFNLLYSRLESHGGCSSGGPSGTFTYFDSNERAFTTVSRTTTSAPTNYSFIGDNNGGAFVLFVGCGDNPVFGTQSAASDAPTYRSWVCIHNSFTSALQGLPYNSTRTSLP